MSLLGLVLMAFGDLITNLELYFCFIVETLGVWVIYLVLIEYGLSSTEK